MKTRIILFLTILIGAFAVSCSDKYIADDAGQFLRTNHQKIKVKWRKVCVNADVDSEVTAAKQYTWSVDLELLPSLPALIILDRGYRTRQDGD